MQIPSRRQECASNNENKNEVDGRQQRRDNELHKAGTLKLSMGS